MEAMPDIGWFVLVGCVAQLIDGALGMAYGTISSAVLLTLGIPPALTSATVHAAEVATTGASAVSHAAFKNIDRRIFIGLAVPGVIGGIAGALALTWLPGDAIKPWVASYLLLLGILIFVRSWREPPLRRPITHPPLLGFSAGALDALGGGGWGAITTSTLIMKGVEPRYAIGTANAAEFFVSIAVAVTLGFALGALYWQAVLGLLIGGVLAAPFAAYAARMLPHRVMMRLVGVVVVVLSAYTLARSLLGPAST
ncbi:MAG TPA: sulfite exporter TauE/SafE family protein [Candidatus Saccharimonadia bacterium]|nr:sulfite exporter TauE/SafE family protein [Candidatus Saccharimonadia bacterium]